MIRRCEKAFTLIELLTVIAIIVILMSLILSVAGFVQDKASRDRARAEIAALSASMESYKADNGIYPMDAASSDTVDPTAGGMPAAASSLFLYKELSGDNAGAPDFQRTGGERDNKVYFEFETKKGMVKRAPDGKVLGLTDPWGNYYGYSTIQAAELQKTNPASTLPGYNPTFDLWSTANDATGNKEKWVTNW